jgi:uncharacterized protein (TIGR02466 family)
MEIEYKSKIELFSAPLITYEVKNFSVINKNLVSEARAWRKTDKGVSVSNSGNSWHSPDGLMSRTEPGFATISKLIPRLAAQYATEINPAFKIKDYGFEASAWVNINRQGGANVVHHHGRFHVSGVYYIKQPKVTIGKSGMIEFVNSRFDHHIFEQLGANAFAPNIRVRPPTGSMVIFPSTLLHFVHPNETSEERITLAWNLRFIKK